MQYDTYEGFVMTVKMKLALVCVVFMYDIIYDKNIL